MSATTPDTNNSKEHDMATDSSEIGTFRVTSIGETATLRWSEDEDGFFVDALVDNTRAWPIFAIQDQYVGPLRTALVRAVSTILDGIDASGGVFGPPIPCILNGDWQVEVTEDWAGASLVSLNAGGNPMMRVAFSAEDAVGLILQLNKALVVLDIVGPVGGAA